VGWTPKAYLGFNIGFQQREQQSVATPHAARGWPHPPCRHFKIQSCYSYGSVAAVQTLARRPLGGAGSSSFVHCSFGLHLP
jgi:hypothetical protein